MYPSNLMPSLVMNEESIVSVRNIVLNLSFLALNFLINILGLTRQSSLFL